jgi:cysteine synthase B
MIAQLFHIEIELVLPEDSTKERTQTMRAWRYCDFNSCGNGIIGSRDYADKSSRRCYVMLNQLLKTTGKRITKQLDQKSGTIPKEL